MGIFTCVNPSYRITRDENTCAIIPREGACAFCLENKPNTQNLVCNNEITNECINSIDADTVIAALKEFYENKSSSVNS
jgi:hypothetical protein